MEKINLNLLIQFVKKINGEHMGNLIFRYFGKGIYDAGTAGNNLTILGWFFCDVGGGGEWWKRYVSDPDNEGGGGDRTFFEKEGNNIKLNLDLLEDDFEALVMPTSHLIELIDQWVEIFKARPDEIVLTERDDGTFFLKAGPYLDEN